LLSSLVTQLNMKFIMSIYSYTTKYIHTTIYSYTTISGYTTIYSYTTISSYTTIYSYTTIQIKQTLLSILSILNPQHSFPNDSYDSFEYYFL
jgi:hypothetical protein